MPLRQGRRDRKNLFWGEATIVEKKCQEGD